MDEPTVSEVRWWGPTRRSTCRPFSPAEGMRSITRSVATEEITRRLDDRPQYAGPLERNRIREISDAGLQRFEASGMLEVRPAAAKLKRNSATNVTRSDTTSPRRANAPAASRRRRRRPGLARSVTWSDAPRGGRGGDQLLIVVRRKPCMSGTGSEPWVATIGDQQRPGSLLWGGAFKSSACHSEAPDSLKSVIRCPFRQ